MTSPILEFMVWLFIVIGVILAFILILIHFKLLFPVIFFFGGVVFIGVVLKLMLRKFEPYEVALIYRWGRFHRASSGGWTFVIPWMEKIGAVVDMREQKDYITVPTITSEGLEVNLSTLLYFSIQNARKVILNVRNYKSALHDFVLSRIRDICAEFTFTQLIVNAEKIFEKLRESMNRVVEGRWGIKVHNIEVEKIEPPRQVMEALKQIRVSRANLEAKRFTAEARRIVIKALGEATKNFNDRTINYLYIKALENMKGAKMMIPTEFLNVFKGAAPGKAIASGLIAGRTFDEAVNMVAEQIKKENMLKDVHIDKKVESAAFKAKK